MSSIYGNTYSVHKQVTDCNGQFRELQFLAAYYTLTDIHNLLKVIDDISPDINCILETINSVLDTNYAKTFTADHAFILWSHLSLLCINTY